MSLRNGLLVVWLVVLAGLTAVRVGVWRDEASLWTDAVAQNPTKPRPLVNLGRAYELRGALELARIAYKEAVGASFDLRRAPYVRRYVRAAAETNLAHLLMKSGGEGDLVAAYAMLQGVVRDYDSFPYSHFNLGAIHQAHGRCLDAVREVQRARAMDPTLAMEGPCFVVTR